MEKSKKLYKDKCFVEERFLFSLLSAECESQINKWGVQEHTIFEWLAYTTEELGETSNAISEYIYRGGNKTEIIKEAIQTATLCLKIAEMML